MVEAKEYEIPIEFELAKMKRIELFAIMEQVGSLIRKIESLRESGVSKKDIKPWEDELAELKEKKEKLNKDIYKLEKEWILKEKARS
jgi:cell division protein FtsB